MFWKTCLMKALLALLLTSEMVRGCRFGLHARRKRQTDYYHYYERTTEQPDLELDSALAVFFEKCLRTAASDIFPSLKTTVDFAIQDTQWYKDVRDAVCTGEKDTAECWISVLPFLLDTRSPLYAPTARCICDWVDGCMPSTYEEKHKWAVQYALKPQQYKNACGEEEYKLKKPLTPFQATFAGCTTEKSETSYSVGSSPAKLDGKSITIFIESHYTYCRRSMVKEFPHEQRVAFALLFMDEACPRMGDGAKWRENAVAALDDCMAEQAPLKSIFNECKKELATQLRDEPSTRSGENPKMQPPVTKAGGCLMVRAEKCFKIVSSPRKIPVEKLERRCKNMDGKLANFYSKEHIERTIQAIREIRSENDTHLMTGMKYDTRRRQLLYSDGKDATFPARWRLWNPNSHPMHTIVLLWVDAKADEVNQGLYNRSEKFAQRFALCEFDV